MLSVVCLSKMIKIDRNCSDFHHFLRGNDTNVATKYNQLGESVWKTWINSCLWIELCDHRIPSYLTKISNGALVPPSGVMKFISESKQWYKTESKTPFDPSTGTTALEWPQSCAQKAENVKNSESSTYRPPSMEQKAIGSAKLTRGSFHFVRRDTTRKKNSSSTNFFCCIALLEEGICIK